MDLLEKFKFREMLKQSIKQKPDLNKIFKLDHKEKCVSEFGSGGSQL